MPHRSIEELVSSVAYHPSHDERRNGKRILRELAKRCKTRAEFAAALDPWLDHRRLSMKAICEKLPMQGVQNYEFYYDDILLPKFKVGMFTVFKYDMELECVDSGGDQRQPMIFAPRLDLLETASENGCFCKAELGLNRAGKWVLLTGIWAMNLPRNRIRPHEGSDFRPVGAQVRVFIDAQMLAKELEGYFPIPLRQDLNSPQRYIAYVLEMIRKERRRQLKAALRELNFQDEWQRSDTDQMLVIREGLPEEAPRPVGT